MKKKVVYLIVIAWMLLVHAEAQEMYVYFSPQNSNLDVSKTTEIKIFADVPDFQGGQIELIYNPDCIDVISYANTSELWGWNSSEDGKEFITFASISVLSGVHSVGTLTVKCLTECSTPLIFQNSLLFDNFGNEINNVSWQEGSVKCKTPSDSQQTGGGGGGGGGLPLPTATPEETATPTTSPTKTPGISIPVLPSTPKPTATSPAPSPSPEVTETTQEKVEKGLPATQVILIIAGVFSALVIYFVLRGR